MVAAINPQSAQRPAATPAKPRNFRNLVRSSMPAFSSMITKTNSTMMRAGIHDDLNRGDEFRAEQQVQTRERHHHHDQRQRAVNGMPLQNQATAPATASAASTKNTTSCGVILSRPISTIAKLVSTTLAMRNRKQQLPAETHELVIAEARKRPAHPDVNKQEDKNLQSNQNGPWIKPFTAGSAINATPPRHIAAPSTGRITFPKIVSYRTPSQITQQHRMGSRTAQANNTSTSSEAGKGESQPPKNRIAPGRNRNHAGVFRHEKHREFEAGIFGVKAGDQFGFRFRQIERHAIGFRDRGDEETQKAQESAESMFQPQNIRSG